MEISYRPNMPMPGGCMHHPPAAMPRPGIGDLPTFRLPSPFEGERFISSRAGGVIIGADGAPAGRVPEGSFVDTKDGRIYGPDSKPLDLPEGATVDFFDLPDLDKLLEQVRAGGPGTGSKDAKTDSTTKDATSTGSGDDAATKTAVDGQWGPGGVTEFKGGAKPAGCDMDHGPTGTKGGGMPANVASLRRQMHDALAQLPQMLPTSMYPPAFPANGPGVLAGGPGSAVGGVHGLGTIPGLHASLMDLVKTLDELAKALQTTTAGGVTQKDEKSSTDGTKASDEAKKADDTSTTTDETSTSTDTTAKADEAKSTDSSTASSSSDDETTATSTDTSTS